MHLMRQVVSRIIRAMGTPLAYKAVKLIEEGDYASLIQLTVEPGDYARAHIYRLDAQVVATFRKLEGLPTGVDLRRQAVNSFFSSELKCKQTNERLAQYNNWFERGFHGDALDLRLFEHLTRVRELIGNVLGPIPQDLTPRFSSGSTFHDKGEAITIPHKISSRPTVTSEAWAVVRDLWSSTAWSRACHLSPEIVRGNRFTTVPKDSSKDRGICIEPSLNVTYQLAVGAVIRDKLTKIGINIKSRDEAVTAQITHRKEALQASIDGLNATIDLSNASDTVSYMLVKLLLPKGWFELLSALRSPATFVENKWIKNHKFSSMGCGFTFELETLIFWALSQSVTSGRVLTYGDDIILPTCDSGCARSLLVLAGFEINAKKSFCDPLLPFRESCGGDYFNGEDVRPIFIKTIPSNPAEWIVLTNQINLIRKVTRSYSNQKLLDEAWHICVNQVALRYRLFGPEWAGDMVIHSEDRKRWRTRPAIAGGQDRGYEELMTLKPITRRVKLGSFSPSVVLASALLQVPSNGPVPRDGISGYKTAWRPTVM